VPAENRHMAVFNADTRMVLDQDVPFKLKAGVEKDNTLIKKKFEEKWDGNGAFELIEYYLVVDEDNPTIPQEAVSLLKQGDIPPCVFPVITDQLRVWERKRESQLLKVKKPIKIQNIPRCKYCDKRHREVCHLVAGYISPSCVTAGPVQVLGQTNTNNEASLLVETYDTTKGLSSPSSSSSSSLAKSSDSGSGLTPKSVLEGRVEEGGDAKFVSNHETAVAVGASSPVGTTRVTMASATAAGTEQSGRKNEEHNEDDGELGLKFLLSGYESSSSEDD